MVFWLEGKIYPPTQEEGEGVPSLRGHQLRPASKKKKEPTTPSKHREKRKKNGPFETVEIPRRNLTREKRTKKQPRLRKRVGEKETGGNKRFYPPKNGKEDRPPSLHLRSSRKKSSSPSTERKSRKSEKSTQGKKGEEERKDSKGHYLYLSPQPHVGGKSLPFPQNFSPKDKKRNEKKEKNIY